MTEANSTPTPSMEINEEKLMYYKEKLRLEQNLILGMGAGAAACLVSAFLWAVISVATGYQIGYMAIAVGLLVGFAIRFVGKGIDPIFGIMGALFALAGCLLGNFFNIIALLSQELSRAERA